MGTGLKNTLRPIAPRWLREKVFVVRIAARELQYWITGRRPPLMAPLLLSYRFGICDVASFEKVGAEFRRHLIAAGLRKGERVLEIGCGTGRMAAALLSHLDGGTYTGLEINASAVKWCQENITDKHPNYEFRHADVRNAFYNPKGALMAATYQLPFGEEAFDFIFLTSVFTHMRIEEIENYLREIRRVLRDGGRCFATWFLLDDESRKAIAAGQSSMDFFWTFGGGLTLSTTTPEEAVAFPRPDAQAAYERCALRIVEIKPGSWSGLRASGSFQDIVVATTAPA